MKLRSRSAVLPATASLGRGRIRVRKQKKNHCAANAFAAMLELTTGLTQSASSWAVPGMGRDGAHLHVLVERANNQGIRTQDMRRCYCCVETIQEQGSLGVQRIKTLLAKGKAVAAIVSKYNHEVASQRLCRPKVENKYTRGRYAHALCIVGFTDATDSKCEEGGGIFEFVNSHGESWPNGKGDGFGNLTYAFLERYLEEAVYVDHFEILKKRQLCELATEIEMDRVREKKKSRFSVIRPGPE